MNTDKDSIKSITGDKKLKISPHNNIVDPNDNDNYLQLSGIVLSNTKKAKDNSKELVKRWNEYPTLKIENEKLQALNSELVDMLEYVVSKSNDQKIWLIDFEAARKLIKKAKLNS